MTDDVELNEVKSPLMDYEHAKENNDGDVPDVDIKSTNLKHKFAGLTKEELEKYAKDPFWKKVRLILFILFWLVWLGMLVGAILIVVLSPKCPKREKLNFWEQKTGYWVDVFGFVDTDMNNVGDFKGLSSRLDYIQKQLGAGYLILDPIFDGQYSNNYGIHGLVTSFREVDPVTGGLESLKLLIKECNKRGMEVVLSVDFNSLAESSKFFEKNHNATVTYDQNMNSWVSRDGNNCNRTFKDKIKYSSSPMNMKMLDLDLKNELVLKEIRESVKMWLGLGVRGFLLTNTAFYMENATMPTTYESRYNISEWYNRQTMKGQIFTAETREMMKELRIVMDTVTKATDKTSVLIAEAGNVGYGLGMGNESDSMLQYLEGPDKIVDMIVSREFLRNRGWNIEQESNSKSQVKSYLEKIPENMGRRVALTSATSTSIRTTNLQKLVAPFLLPGNPIIYFGTEVGNECNIKEINGIQSIFYPKALSFPLDNVAGELPSKCNHMVMPWDTTGMGFSNKNGTFDDSYIKSVENTVMSLTAIGREETILQLHQKLIKIRKEPSLQWGKVKIILNEQTLSSSYEIFVREAEGFPKIIAAIIRDSVDGRVFSLLSECDKVTPVVVYPANENLPENKEVEANNIYLKIHKKESIHVFKCSTK